MICLALSTAQQISLLTLEIKEKRAASILNLITDSLDWLSSTLLILPTIFRV